MQERYLPKQIPEQKRRLFSFDCGGQIFAWEPDEKRKRKTHQNFIIPLDQEDERWVIASRKGRVC